MVDKELIEDWRNMVKLLISSLLFKTNYEGMGEQDKEEFERDFDEILDLALIGLKYKAQLSQEGTTKGTTTDTISRQAAIEAVSEACFELRGVFERCEDAINALPSAQKKGHWINEETNYICSECHRGCWVNSDYCPWCGADMRGIQE